LKVPESLACRLCKPESACWAYSLVQRDSIQVKTFQQMMILNLTLINIIKKVTTFTEFAGKALAYYS
jgi:hypothetical protein